MDAVGKNKPEKETTDNLLKQLLREFRRFNEARSLDWRALSRQAAAEYLGCHPDTVYRLAKEGELAFFQANRGAPMKFTRQDLDSYREKIRYSEH